MGAAQKDTEEGAKDAENRIHKGKQIERKVELNNDIEKSDFI